MGGRPSSTASPWTSISAGGRGGDIINEPFRIADMANRFRVMVRVVGGGVHSQAEAIRHGIARALVAYDAELKVGLRRNGLITRDARIKESKKYGLKRARRAPQYTKR